MAKRGTTRSRPGRGLAIFVSLLIGGLVLCVVTVALVGLLTRERGTRDVKLRIAHSPEKAEVFYQLVDSFNQTKPRLPNGKRITIETARFTPGEMMELVADNQYHAVSPDSSVWLREIDRYWTENRGNSGDLVGESTRYMVSPVVIAMWEEVATSLGYPDKQIGWQDLLAAAESPGFRWSHPSTQTASGLLTTLAMFYAGADVTRDLTKELATAESTLEYVARLEKTVSHYGEGELAVMEQIEAQGRDYLDAFIVQEQLVVQHNLSHDQRLVAIYPIEGTLWEDHPLALIEHPERTDDERQAYSMFRDYLLSRETQMEILRHGYRPTDLNIPLDSPNSPITQANGVDPTEPQTTLQIPSSSVIAVVKDAWLFTKRPANIYLVVDVSGSMEGRKMQEMRSALQAFLDQIPSDRERVGLIAFSSSAQEVVPLTQLGDGRDRLEDAVSSLYAGGNTALLDGVDLAVTKLSDLQDTERINAIVAMTDGKENQSRTRISELRDKLDRAADSDVPVVVFCIGYGSDADFELLETISGASGGFTREANTETIRNLYQILSTYF
ncbi:MAG: VWA domain-containing protein [Chloroflexi bacterium]|jgi:Ca-activated chloride channel family protein|nr:VWA domain-containing protein [Chloroflexota bacterium]